MSETDISRSIRDSLEAIGYWVERTNSGRVKVRGGWMRLCSNGTPDTLIVAPLYGWLETKTAKTNLNEDQREWHAKAAKRGVKVAVVRSVGEAVRIVEEWRLKQ